MSHKLFKGLFVISNGLPYISGAIAGTQSNSKGFQRSLTALNKSVIVTKDQASSDYLVFLMQLLQKISKLMLWWEELTASRTLGSRATERVKSSYMSTKS